MAATAPLPSTPTSFFGLAKSIINTPSSSSSLELPPSDLSDQPIPTLLRQGSLHAHTGPIPFSVGPRDATVQAAPLSPGAVRSQSISFASESTDEYLPPTPSPVDSKLGKRKKIEHQPPSPVDSKRRKQRKVAFPQRTSSRIAANALNLETDLSDTLELDDLPHKPKKFQKIQKVQKAQRTQKVQKVQKSQKIQKTRKIQKTQKPEKIVCLSIPAEKLAAVVKNLEDASQPQTGPQRRSTRSSQRLQQPNPQSTSPLESLPQPGLSLPTETLAEVIKNTGDVRKSQTGALRRSTRSRRQLQRLSPQPTSSPESVQQPVHSRQNVGQSILSPPTSQDESNIQLPSSTTTAPSQDFAEEEQKFADISRALIALSDPPEDPSSSKPPPVREPEVWADGRQALCETLPYYHAYQSGGYVSGGFAYGFMVDKESSARDYMDSEVLITRAGGGLSRDANSGSMVRGSDQSLKSSQVQGVRNSMDSFNPVAIISGDRNPQAPCAMPHPYNVLDWFKPAYVWAEKSNGHIVVKYRFEKLDKDKSSWWMPRGLQEPAKLGSLPAPEIKTCDDCSESSTRVYLQGWMCLQPQCANFWKIDGLEPEEASLLYDPRFLKQYTPWGHSSAPQPLRPEPMRLGSMPVLGDDVSWSAGKGIACPDCGRCNSREVWKGWQCGNPTCSFEYSLPHSLIPPYGIRNPYDPCSKGYTSSKDQVLSSSIGLEVEFANNYRIHKYIIPGIPGFIAHFIANGTVNEERDGPDDMWTELQLTEIGLCRRPLQCSTLRGPMLTQHFSVNYGMPYKFIASTESHSFENACKAIKDSRSRLNWAARQCNPDHGNEFNELLALGYFERQGIDYHDDGEKGLGPTIATLSLGSTSNMKIRMKSKHHNGATKSGAYVDLPPIPGCLKYEERKAAHDALEQLRAQGELDAAKARVKQLPKQLGLKSKGNAKDVLNMFLRHGDIVIMHGAEIQQYFEHTVEHAGKLRFALTCRYIDPESLPPADRPSYMVEADQGVYDGRMLPDTRA